MCRNAIVVQLLSEVLRLSFLSQLACATESTVSCHSRRVLLHHPTSPFSSLLLRRSLLRAPIDAAYNMVLAMMRSLIIAVCVLPGVTAQQNQHGGLRDMASARAGATRRRRCSTVPYHIIPPPRQVGYRKSREVEHEKF
eukprot:2346749-Pleurochrysis_carterae.AAC.3